MRQKLAQVLILDCHEFSSNKGPYLLPLRWLVVSSVVLWRAFFI